MKKFFAVPPAALQLFAALIAINSITALNVPPKFANDGFSGPPRRPLGSTVNPEANMNTTEILAFYGYPAEIHEVTTSDGYILVVHRIPHGINNQTNNGTARPVVFLQHGLLAASDSWIMNTPDECLPTLLADAGYDVWMGNFRGNYYNHRHLVYPVTSVEFWTFSFDEMGRLELERCKLPCRGSAASFDARTPKASVFRQFSSGQESTELKLKKKAVPPSRQFVVTSPQKNVFCATHSHSYDLPAMVDKALEVSNQTELVLIAHSQGTTASFISLSADPDDFRKKVKLAVMLAPIIYVNDIRSPLLRALSHISYDLTLWFKLVGYNDFLPENSFTKWFAKHVCPTWGWGEICDHLVFLISGYDPYMFNRTRSDVYASHFPAGTSSMDMAHFGQCVKSAKFGMFDWGSKTKNMEHYGQSEPPLYHPENVTTPVALFQAQNDWLAPISDVQRLKNALPNVVLDYMVPYASFNHVDFVLGFKANFFVYDAIFTLLKKYENVTKASVDPVCGV